MKTSTLTPLTLEEVSSTEGGFVPVVIFGAAFGAKTVAAVAGATAAAITYFFTH
ncbi:class IIb bacteriocin, lactobin A/cerein 7B family [Lewinella sp. IMCC34191]|uniref:class IIb bacteriocin, lactobin A/cerein 7B family n=1 Tax=Lewinella sp. IMCC34191 TaxID=2259172 RepID=UPI000E25B588|nr:class IIb bacteriocin, lactobin A/cerein 7B family [Lewinella sp. IMCC34191]